MLSISSGHSADYLTGQVAGGRESYYLDASTAGEPPGRWGGNGAKKLGLEGEVDADEMKALYGDFCDPRDPRWNDPATRAQCAKMGRAPGNYKTPDQLVAERLKAEPDALPERVAEIRQECEAQARQPVAFIDATFSPDKSVTVAHTAFSRAELDAQKAGDQVAAGYWAGKRLAVEEAIWAGNNAMIDHLQDKAGYSRTGRHGAGAGRWVDAHDWTVASFHQSDSRDHDPQQHIHNAILNRVVCEDGQVRTLDSQAIHKHKQGAGAIGERVMEEHLSASLGATWSVREDGTGRTWTEVDQGAQDLFSERSAKIGVKLAQEVDRFREHFHREPNSLELTRLRQQSAMATRRSKSHDGETHGERLDRWDAKLREEVAGGLHRVADTLAAKADQAGDQVAEEFSPSGVVAEAVARCQEVRPAFSRSELVRQIIIGLPGRLGTDRVAELAEGLADQALANPDLVVRVTGAQPTRSLPEELKVANGTSSYAAPGGPRFATQGHVVAEQALRRAAVERGALAVPVADVDRWLATSGPGAMLGEDQAAAVRGICSSGAKLSVLVGPAGTGKSFTVGAAAQAWSELTGGRLVGLATSQIATEVLRDDGVEAMNTARWLATQDRLADNTRPRDPRDSHWALTDRDVVVVDEASMVDTAVMARVRAHVQAAGAKMVLAGDPRQLAAVGAGGAMAMLADGTAETYTLSEVRRFSAPWEARASLQLREGDSAVLAEYDRRGRVLDGGTVESAGIQAARAYLGDTLAGRSSLVVTGTNAAASAVSATIRDELVRLGRVDTSQEVVLGRDGNTAGLGDLVQARQNDWNAGLVNRQRYVVEEIHEDGSMRVRVDGGTETREMSAGYVEDHVALGYASTAHSAQGVTVDTSHAVVTPGMSAEAMYVAMSRGRDGNTAHVATQPEVAGEFTGETHERERQTPGQVMGDILGREAEEEKAALVQAAEDAKAAGSMHTIHARQEDAVRHLGRARVGTWLDQLADEGVISGDERAAFAGDQATEQLGRLLRTAEQAGHDPREVLRSAIGERSLDGLQSLAQGVHARITKRFEGEGGSLAPKLDQAAAMVPEDAPEAWRDYLGELAEAADTRRRELGSEVAANPPQWATEALGPVPDGVIERAEWEHRAGLVAGHREATNWTREDVALGPASGTSSTERRASWHSAWDALGRPEAGVDERDMSEGQLRVRVTAWEREQTWAPAYVNDEMRATGQAVARHEQDAAILDAQAAVEADAVRAAELADEAAGRREVAEQLRTVQANLERVAEERAAWYVETAATREAGERARRELVDRGKDLGAEPDRVTAEEWLAAEAKARVEDDAHRPITEENAPSEVWDEEAGDLVQVDGQVEEAAPPAEVEPAPALDNVVEAELVEEPATAAEPEVVDQGDVVEAELVEEDQPVAEPEAAEPDVVDAELVEEPVAEVEEEPEAPAEPDLVPGAPSVARTEAMVAAAEAAAEELASRRAAEEAHRVAEATQEAADAQAAREAAWRADQRAAEAADLDAELAAEDAAAMR